jgi:hypothetical protein
MSTSVDLTPAECRAWINDKTRNPRTGRKIIETGKVYKALAIVCLKSHVPSKSCSKLTKGVCIRESACHWDKTCKTNIKSKSPSKSQTTTKSPTKLTDLPHDVLALLPLNSKMALEEVSKQFRGLVKRNKPDLAEIVRVGMELITKVSADFPTNIYINFIQDPDDVKKCGIDKSLGLEIRSGKHNIHDKLINLRYQMRFNKAVHPSIPSAAMYDLEEYDQVLKFEKKLQAYKSSHPKFAQAIQYMKKKLLLCSNHTFMENPYLQGLVAYTDPVSKLNNAIDVDTAGFWHTRNYDDEDDDNLHVFTYIATEDFNNQAQKKGGHFFATDWGHILNRQDYDTSFIDAPERLGILKELQWHKMNKELDNLVDYKYTISFDKSAKVKLAQFAKTFDRHTPKGDVDFWLFLKTIYAM